MADIDILNGVAADWILYTLSASQVHRILRSCVNIRPLHLELEYLIDEGEGDLLAHVAQTLSLLETLEVRSYRRQKGAVMSRTPVCRPL